MIKPSYSNDWFKSRHFDYTRMLLALCAAIAVKSGVPLNSVKLKKWCDQHLNDRYTIGELIAIGEQIQSGEFDKCKVEV